MKKQPNRYVLLLIASCVGMISTGCKEGEEKAPPAETSAVDSSIEGVFLASEPAGAISVIEARTKSEPGTEVTVTGKIAGAQHPFTDGFATLVLGDAKLETCDLIPGDSCETPWDACCVDPETLKAQRLTIQVVGDDGRPIGSGLKGVKGLKEMDSLVVTGTVADGSSAENLVINATGIYPKK